MYPNLDINVQYLYDKIINNYTFVICHAEAPIPESTSMWRYQSKCSTNEKLNSVILGVS